MNKKKKIEKVDRTYFTTGFTLEEAIRKLADKIDEIVKKLNKDEL